MYLGKHVSVTTYKNNHQEAEVITFDITPKTMLKPIQELTGFGAGHTC